MCRLVEGCKLGCFSEILAILLQECPTETLPVDICIRNIIPWLTGCKEWGIKKWTGLRGHNSRSKAARAKRFKSCEILITFGKFWYIVALGMLKIKGDMTQNIKKWS